jgi:sporulation protein YlmC with PRC-barrel domain
MTPDGALKLLSEVRDLQIVDNRGRLCGICDDIEVTKDLKLSALLVGPGAYEMRLPALLYRIILWAVGGNIVRVPWEAVDHITSRIFLKVPGEELGLRQIENRLSAAFPRHPIK